MWALARASGAGWTSPETLAALLAQRLGSVFAIATSSAVFSAHGHLGRPAAVTAGFRPALWSCVIFAALAAVTAAGSTARTPDAAAETRPADASPLTVASETVWCRPEGRSRGRGQA